MKIIGIDRRPPVEYVHPKQTLRSLAKKMEEQMREARRKNIPEGIIDITAERALRRLGVRRNETTFTPPSGQDAYGSYEPRNRREMI